MIFDLGWARVSLLPSAPYSICDESQSCVLGLALERQRGVHAIGCEQRHDFDAWPGDLALTSLGTPIFSESEQGGEYLTIHLNSAAPDLLPEGGLASPRTVFHGDRQIVQLGWCLRRWMLVSQAPSQSLEEAVAAVLGRAMSLLNLPACRTRGDGMDRQAHVRVLEYIDDTIQGSLSLDEIAGVAGMPVLRFLRSFTKAVGSTPHAYVTERRLQKARRLLRHTEEPIAGIAVDCGFAHQSHLGVAFMDRLGWTPRQYRALAQQD